MNGHQDDTRSRDRRRGLSLAGVALDAGETVGHDVAEGSARPRIQPRHQTDELLDVGVGLTRRVGERQGMDRARLVEEVSEDLRGREAIAQREEVAPERPGSIDCVIESARYLAATEGEQAGRIAGVWGLGEVLDGLVREPEEGGAQCADQGDRVVGRDGVEGGHQVDDLRTRPEANPLCDKERDAALSEHFLEDG